jgi:hypothetical protein
MGIFQKITKTGQLHLNPEIIKTADIFLATVLFSQLIFYLIGKNSFQFLFWYLT